jgi:hypothetical protein
MLKGQRCALYFNLGVIIKLKYLPEGLCLIMLILLLFTICLNDDKLFFNHYAFNMYHQGNIEYSNRK